jgi:hypothetical protein
MNKTITTLASLTLLALLGACGGGSSESSKNAAIQPACEVKGVSKIDIETANGDPIVSKESYLNANVALTDENGGVITFSTQIRGRGNTTWNMPKKPYRLKLSESIGLLGMPTGQNWNLLANYADKTLIRTAVAFCIAQKLGMKWVPESKFAELTLNGKYDGLYQMTPHIEPGPNKANLGDGEGVKFLAEIDAFLDGDYPKTTNYGTKLILKSKANAASAKKIYQFIDEMEWNLYSNQDPWVLIDKKSLADTYIVNELSRNVDAFYKSTFFYKSTDSPVIFGPIWDFDISMGNIDYNDAWLTEGFSIKHRGYLGAAFKISDFDAEVRTQWKVIHDIFPSLLVYINSQSEALEKAQRRNFKRWDILDIYVWPNQKVTGDYDLEVQYLKDWLSARFAWLDEQYKSN